MKAIVLGGGSDQCSLIEELKHRNIDTILVDYYERPPAKELVKTHYVVSTLDQKAVLRIARDEQADLVVTACIDQALLTAAYVSEELGLPWPYSYEKALKVTNKTLMKEVFLASGLPTSRFKAANDVTTALNHCLSYPVVVKPVDSNGSFGVSRVNSFEEMKPAVTEALQISRSHGLIIEEYVDGVELSVDAFVSNGQTHLLLVTETKKIPSIERAFPICQSQYPVSLPGDIMDKIWSAVHNIVAAFELDNTPLLVQLVVSHSDVFVLEFGARIAGGSKHHLIKHITGFDVMKAFVDTLYGESVRVVTHPIANHVATSYIYAQPGIFSRVAGIDTLMRNNTIASFFLYKTSGMEVTNNMASRDRIGAHIVEGSSKAELQKKLDYADRTVQVMDQVGNDIMLHGLHR